MRGGRLLKSDRHRCESCRLHRSLCLCALVPRVPTRTRVLLIQHQLELRKTTNTGALAARCLPNSAVVVRGGPPPSPETVALWTSTSTAVLLFPHTDAQPLERWRACADPVTLVVPDGTWPQATRARQRLPGLDRLPCASLPAQSVSGYRLRHASHPGRLSTLEAIARALAILEAPAVAAPLEWIFRVMVDRTLWTNGRLSADQVTGGIPEGALSHDPWSGRAIRSAVWPAQRSTETPGEKTRDPTGN